MGARERLLGGVRRGAHFRQRLAARDPLPRPAIAAMSTKKVVN